LRQLGIDTAMDKVVGTLAQSLPGWGALPTAPGAAPSAAGLEIKAMRQIVSLAEDPAEAGKRFRELVHVAIEQFNTGHLGRKHAGWIGLLVDLTIENGGVIGCQLRFVRSNDNNESFFCRLADEDETLADLTARSGKLGATLKPEGDHVRVTL
jgi:hypothetical protein